MLHSVTRFPDVNSHSCRMSRTNAPWDTMPHDSWLGCDPARCGNWAARGLEFKRTKYKIPGSLMVVHATVQFPDVNCHRCLMLCTHAPWDTIPHVSWLGCEPTHCVNGAVGGPDSSGRWACGANSLEIVFDSANAWVRTGLSPLRHTSCCCFVLADCLVD